MEAYIFKKKYYLLSLYGLIGCLLVIVPYSATVGTADIAFWEAFRIILSKVPLISDFMDLRGIESTHFIIMFDIRIPRIVMAALVGAGLSVTGTVYQGIFKNPMADPYVLGISSGAALGATIAIISGFSGLFWGVGAISGFAFIAALGTMVLVYRIARTGSRVQTVLLLLSGIAVSFLFSSIISLLMILNRDQVENIVFWLMGSVSSAGWEQIAICFPVIILGIVCAGIFSRDLNIILTGDESARSLGVEIETVKKILLVICSVMIAICVSFSGIIGFVGLVVPHVFKMIFGSDHRVVLPLSCFGGAIFMVLADTIARTLLSPVEIPVGIITAMIGAPYFIGLILKNKKKVV